MKTHKFLKCAQIQFLIINFERIIIPIVITFYYILSMHHTKLIKQYWWIKFLSMINLKTNLDVILCISYKLAYARTRSARIAYAHLSSLRSSTFLWLHSRTNVRSRLRSHRCAQISSLRSLASLRSALLIQMFHQHRGDERMK